MFFPLSRLLKGIQLNLVAFARGGRWYYLGTAHDQSGNEVILTRSSIINQLPGQGGIYTLARGRFVDIRPYSHQPDGCLCLFEVYQNGETIFSREDEVCPTVSIVPCRLSEDWKVLKIEKEPIWQKIQVVNNNSWWEIISELKEFINGDIPDECIEVWLTPTLDLDVTPGNNRAEKYQLIGQYCSAPGCPPPAYQVICHEDCKGCPEGTCEVDCGDHICCYDDKGIVPAPKENITWDELKNIRWYRGGNYGKIKFVGRQNYTSGWFRDKSYGENYFNQIANLTTLEVENLIFPEHSNPKISPAEIETRVYRAFKVFLGENGEPKGALTQVFKPPVNAQ